METTNDLTFDTRDSAPFMMKARVIDQAFTWGRNRPLQTAWEKTVIYEAHVRGFTMRHPEVQEDIRGTYAGLASQPALDYVRSLGVTAIELLPVHTFVDDSYLTEKGLKNYWGYNTIGFFAPARRYAANPDFAFAEFKEMVGHLHDAGLEVILDVVYNHTAEGNELGPTLSFKGIDNASYYRLAPDPRYYINDTGTGNTVNLVCCNSWETACATGRRRCMWMASASTLRRSSPGNRTASIRMAASWMPVSRIRC
jgi:glycogen operon protein